MNGFWVRYPKNDQSIAVDTFDEVSFRLEMSVLLIEVRAPMDAITIKAMINPYSRAVAPFWLWVSFFKNFIIMSAPFIRNVPL